MFRSNNLNSLWDTDNEKIEIPITQESLNQLLIANKIYKSHLAAAQTLLEFETATEIAEQFHIPLFFIVTFIEYGEDAFKLQKPEVPSSSSPSKDSTKEDLS
jgi:RNAse (barnase) inhibitor barstar